MKRRLLNPATARYLQRIGGCTPHATAAMEKEPAILGEKMVPQRIWRDLCLDKRFEDAPYKIETNAAGQIIMSPTRNWHGYYAAWIARVLNEQMKSGKVMVECAAETAGGVKVADVAWVSDERFEIIKGQFSSSVAPEICVEVLSLSNTLEEMMAKRHFYLGAGATEYWLCDETGLMQFLDQTGMIERSQLCPDFPRRVG